MKTSTLALLALGGYLVYRSQKSAAAQQQAVAAAAAAAPAAPAQVPAGSSLSGSTLDNPTLFSKGGMGIFG